MTTMNWVFMSVTILVVVLFFGPILYWDKGRRSLVLALRGLWLHKLRAFLSVLGIIIGTGAVIALMAFGEGSMQDALNDIRRMGATNIIVRSAKPPENSGTQSRARVAMYGLTPDDYDRFSILRDNGTVTRMVPMRSFNQEMRRGYRAFTGRAVGTTPAYAEVNELPIAMGRFLRPEDESVNVAVIGSNVAQGLFPFENPLGKRLTMSASPYTVIGVLKNRMPLGDSGGQSSEDYNNDLYIPLTTCNEFFGGIIMTRQAGSFQREQVALTQVTLTVKDIEKVRSTGDWIKDLLSKQHDKADWLVSVPLDKLEAAEREQTRSTRLMAIIAGISLVVGGIGIMNIMLATVTERTREIGIRRALGAKRRDITMQFLIEAVVQTSLGGLLGVLSGLFVVFVLPPLSQWLWSAHVPASVHVPSIFLSLLVSVGVGVGFGLYPAYRAAMLDPIEALRHE